MEKIIKKVVKTGYGLGLLSLLQAKQVVGKVKKDFNLNEKESLRLARELVKNSEKASKDVLKVAAKNFDSALAKTGLTSKRELKSIRKKIKKRVKDKLKPRKIAKIKIAVKRRVKKVAKVKRKVKKVTKKKLKVRRSKK